VVKLKAPPLRITQTSESMALQRNQEEKATILYDRPEPHPDIPHVALLYDGFGEFLDIFHGRKEVSGLELWKQQDLEHRINDFADEMAGFYETERDRRLTVIPNMNLILTALACEGQRSPFLRGAFDPPMPVGHIMGEHGAMSCIVLFKNESCDIEIMPHIELTNHVARSFNEAIRQGRNRELFQAWKVPCLGITVVGGWVVFGHSTRLISFCNTPGFEVTFYAVVFLGQNQYRIPNLTPGLPCRSSAEDGVGRRTLYSAFMAATVLIARIWEDTKKVIITPPSRIFGDTHRFPCVSALPRYNEGLPGTLNFNIVRPFMRGPTNNSLLYIAVVREGDKDKEIVVKFTRRYCIELHTFCAITGNAPRILGYQRLPGNWIAIAMEHVSAQSIIKAPGRNKRRKQWAAAARKLVKSFHDRGWVHGDLRDVNILCDKHRLMLVDFNWGGKDEEACYPTSILPEELWDACLTAGDLKIRKENDIRALEMTLTKIGVC
jgi:hypothetical protein